MGQPAARVAHVMTVPQSLYFLTGQPPFLRDKGMEVHAVASPGPDLGRFGGQEGVTVHAVEMGRRITPFRDLVTVVRLWRLFRRLRPDVVHAATPKGGLLGMAAAWLARVPVRIYHIHGLPLVTARGVRRALLTGTETVSCRLAHHVLCVSHSVRRLAVDAGLCPPGKVETLRAGSANGVDAAGRFHPGRLPEGTRAEVRARYALPADAVVAGFVGRIVRDKGLVELAGAWRELRAACPGLHLLVVGPFEPQDPVPPEVDAWLRSDPRVRLAGHTREIAPLYAAMDVVVLPTYREGFNTVLLEAAAMGLPAVASRVPGCVDAVVDGVTGTLVPPRDAPALAAAIRRYVEDSDLRRRHGQAGREHVLRHFRPEDLREAVYAVYCRLLGQARGRAAPPAAAPAGGPALCREVVPS
jgi:glycosyltransferase involved in cell wall biosynthesis